MNAEVLNGNSLYTVQEMLQDWQERTRHYISLNCARLITEDYSFPSRRPSYYLDLETRKKDNVKCITPMYEEQRRAIVS